MTDVCAPPDTYMYTQTSLPETHTEDPGRTLLRVDQWWGFPSENAVSVSHPRRHPLDTGCLPCGFPHAYFHHIPIPLLRSELYKSFQFNSV